jgi:thioredoxin reductase (NADPH)
MLKSTIQPRAGSGLCLYPFARQERTLPILEQIPDTLPRRKTQSRPQNWADVLIIGAGPTGLACAIEAQRVGLRVLVLDKGCLVNSLFNYPANMTFFTTPELLEIGEIPFATANMKPNRQEALEYYRRVAERFQLKVLQYHWVKTVTGFDNDFRVTATDRSGGIHDFETRKIVVATGYYDLPNLMHIPGEDLPKVSHYYREPHPYYDSDVVVIGGKNSAAIAALELWRHGARVTLVYRGSQMHSHVKYWIKPDIENRIKNHEITAYFKSCVTEIATDYVIVKTPQGPVHLDNDFVFALTGYHPDYDFLQSLGIELSKEQCRPVCDPETLESNVPGIYVAGVIVAGAMTNEIFIENGRFHGKLIAEHLRMKLSGKA